MSRWKNPQKIADKHYYCTNILTHQGPCCYELIVAGVRGGNAQIVYVGETGNEKRRISDHARRNSHLRKLIDDALSKGWNLYYRSQSFASKNQAINLQNRLLSKNYYLWNSIGN